MTSKIIQAQAMTLDKLICSEEDIPIRVQWLPIRLEGGL